MGDGKKWCFGMANKVVEEGPAADIKTKAAEILTNVIKRRKAEEVLLKEFKKTKPTVD